MKGKAPFVRHEFNYDMNEASDASGLRCEDESLAKQSFAEEADINTIVRRFHLTGELPSDVRAPTYADYNDVFDFHSAMNAIASAHEAFDSMPAAIRERFHNSPAEFVDFCSDEKNRSEGESLGLVFKKEKKYNDLVKGGDSNGGIQQDGRSVDRKGAGVSDKSVGAVVGEASGVADAAGSGSGRGERVARVESKG